MLDIIIKMSQEGTLVDNVCLVFSPAATPVAMDLPRSFKPDKIRIRCVWQDTGVVMTAGEIGVVNSSLFPDQQVIGYLSPTNQFVSDFEFSNPSRRTFSGQAKFWLQNLGTLANLVGGRVLVHLEFTRYSE